MLGSAKWHAAADDRLSDCGKVVAKLFSPRGIGDIKGPRMGSRRQFWRAVQGNKGHYFGSPLAGRQARTK